MTTGNGKWCDNNKCVNAPSQEYYCESIDPVHDPDGPCNSMSDMAPRTKSPSEAATQDE